MSFQIRLRLDWKNKSSTALVAGLQTATSVLSDCTCLVVVVQEFLDFRSIKPNDGVDNEPEADELR